MIAERETTKDLLGVIASPCPPRYDLRSRQDLTDSVRPAAMVGFCTAVPRREHRVD